MICASDLSVGYGNELLVQDLSFDLPSGEVMALIGSSGSGKTTLLRTLAGLHQPARGHVQLLGSSPAALFGSGRVQFLHQTPALWKHLTARQHISLGLALAGKPDKQGHGDEVLRRVGLAGSEHKYPHELSVGMRARLALARAFAAPPEVLLMDEPFASLDPERREQLNMDVQNLRNAAGCTVVMVTHDVIEAIRFATRFLVFPRASSRPLMRPNDVTAKIEDPNLLGDDARAMRDTLTDMLRGSRPA